MVQVPIFTRGRHTVPPNVAAAVSKSIEKLPADRFESAKEFREALDDATFTYATRPATTAAVAPPSEASRPSPWQRNRRLTALGASLSAVVLLAALAAWGWLRPTPERGLTEMTRFTIVPPTEAPLNFSGLSSDLAISPDGRQLVYVSPVPDGSAPQLNLRSLDRLGSAPLRGGEGGFGPFFSPDGAWVGFVFLDRQNVLQRVSTLGGSPVTLTEAPGNIVGASWGADDQIVFGTRGGLFRVSGGGGEPEALTTIDPEQPEAHLWPSIIGDREAVVFTIAPLGTPAAQSGQLAVLDLDTREVTRLGLDGFSPRYLPTGHLIYAVGDGSVRAVPFDARSLTVTGSTVPLLEGVQVKSSGAAAFDVSRDGRLVYALGGAGGGVERSLVWVDRDGREEALGAEPRAYVYPRLSPDGGRLALDVRGEDNDIWIWDFRAETLTRMILGDGAYTYPVWTPDGQRIAYSVDGDFYWTASNNAGGPELLAGNPGGGGAGGPNPHFFTPDGAALVFRDQAHPDTDDDLGMISLESDSVVWRLNGNFIERNPELSPDGRWMAYQSDESGGHQVHVRSFPNVDDYRVQVSNNGGRSPLWSRDGRELFYLQGSELAVVTVDAPDEVFSFRDRTILMDFPYRINAEGRAYDVSLDGQRFLAVKDGDASGEAPSAEITVVLNWFTELRERMGG